MRTMPADPDSTGAPRDRGALVDDPPTEQPASPTALDEFFSNGDVEPANDRARRRERREVAREAEAAAVPAPAPVRYQARKVHRLVRHIEPWSVLKISLIFFFCIWIILLTAGVILWQVASNSGIIDNVESFIEEIFALKQDSFHFEAGQMFRAYAVGGLVMVVAATGFTVLLAVLFNLISDLTGGVRVTVVEEETARPIPPSERPKRRPERAPTGSPEA
jgi:hypothetical protein